jgi:hypothetical protein
MEQIRKQVFEATDKILTLIINKHFRKIEKLKNEFRFVIDLEIVYSEIKNEFLTIIDFLADRFRIIDRRILERELVIRLYSDNVRKCLLSINKILPSTFFKTKYIENEFREYLKLKINECIFNSFIVFLINNLSLEKNYFSYYIVLFFSIIIIFLIIIVRIKYKK